MSHRSFFLVFSVVLVELLSVLPTYAQPAATGRITVTVGEFNVKGTAIIALYDSTAKAMVSDNLKLAVRKTTVPVTKSRLTIVFDSIPKGKYAILVIHDENTNGRYEYLKEDFAVSNNARGSFGPVSFKNAAFLFDGKQLNLSIYIENEKIGRSGNYSNTVAFAPVFGYSPETSFLLGANVIKLFKLKGADSLTRTSFADVFAAFTFNKQLIVEQNYTVFSNREKFMFIGLTAFSRFPQYYYGVGNDLPESNKELVKYNQFRFEHLALRKVYKQLFAGIGYRYVSLFDLSSEANGELNTSQVTGYQGAVVSGVQAAISSDNRDNIYNTSAGHLLRVKATFNSGTLGSRYDFQSYEFDARKFFSLSKTKRRILALQAYAYFSSGDVPWNEMGALGSDVIMRGYYSGRYRDRNYIAAQAEYRITFNKMFGMVLFAGGGEVASQPGNFTVQGIKPNGGFGFRMTLDRKERLNLRLDFGFGQNTSNTYFSVAEAF